MYEELRDKLTAICEKFEALTGRMGEPDLLADREAYRKAARTLRVGGNRPDHPDV